MEKTTPKVLITYSHESKEHQDKVLEFSNKLRVEGVDAILDQYEDSPPEGWPKWMDRNIKNSDFVIIVCTEKYYSSVMGTETKGLGVSWESSLIYQHLYNAASNNIKFIPVLFSDGDKKNIPEPLQGATYYNIDSSTDYDKLYWQLLGKKPEKPEIGKARTLPIKERKTLFITGFIDVDLWDKAGWKGVAFLHDYAKKYPSSLGLLFTNKEAAINIFKGWRKRLGEFDDYNELRISIVEGDVVGEEYGYFVHINSYPANITKRVESTTSTKVGLMMIVSRIHRMNPAKDSNNLSEFKERFKLFGCYELIPAVLHKDNRIEVIDDLRIFKKNIELRQFKDIKDKNDPDSVLIKNYLKINFA